MARKLRRSGISRRCRPVDSKFVNDATDLITGGNDEMSLLRSFPQFSDSVAIKILLLRSTFPGQEIVGPRSVVPLINFSPQATPSPRLTAVLINRTV
jgi:hypothetical protein